ncbi:hypothetical protein [Rhodococcus koreensis]
MNTGWHSDDQSPQHLQANVELDIFSGNPNPTWQLINSDAAHFLDALDSLSRTDRGRIENALGYRGFIVRIPGHGIVRIQNGTVEIVEDGRYSYRIDAGRLLERWLLQTGISAVPTELYEMLRDDLGV